jgi:quercetin dioxygenase-like cupin family protein
MSATSATTRTKTEGAVKAGGGNCIFQLTDMAGIKAGPAYSTATGPLVEGQSTQVGLMRKAKGTGARPHSHPNEQWNYVVKGRLRVNIDGREEIVGPGTLLYFPPNVVHSTVAMPEEDVYFFVVKDLSHGIHGTPAAGQPEGAFYEPGFEPGKA